VRATLRSTGTTQMTESLWDPARVSPCAGKRPEGGEVYGGAVHEDRAGVALSTAAQIAKVRVAPGERRFSPMDWMILS
jgi:hypothetical protein